MNSRHFSSAVALQALVGWVFLLPLGAQTAPVIDARPSSLDKTISGHAQPMTSEYTSVSLYLCVSFSAPVAPDCSADSSRKQKLPNIGVNPFLSTDPNGVFTLSLAAALPPGAFVWVTQVTVTTSGTRATLSSTSVRVYAPLLRSATLSVSGTDSASRDAGGKAALDLQSGQVTQKPGEMTFTSNIAYDDKWKSSKFSANITQNYGGTLSNQWQIGARGRRTQVDVGPEGTAYHNNTQGIRVEQSYGAGIVETVGLGAHSSLELSQGPRAILDTLYSTSQQADLAAFTLGMQLPYEPASGVRISLQASWTPVFNQSKAWSANGRFSLDAPFSKHWSFDLTVEEDYHEIAPKTFNKNYLAPSVGIKFKTTP